MMSKQLNSPTGQEKKNYALRVRRLNTAGAILNEYRNNMNNWEKKKPEIQQMHFKGKGCNTTTDTNDKDQL